MIGLLILIDGKNELVPNSMLPSLKPDLKLLDDLPRPSPLANDRPNVDPDPVCNTKKCMKSLMKMKLFLLPEP